MNIVVTNNKLYSCYIKKLGMEVFQTIILAELTSNNTCCSYYSTLDPNMRMHGNNMTTSDSSQSARNQLHTALSLTSQADVTVQQQHGHRALR